MRQYKDINLSIFMNSMAASLNANIEAFTSTFKSPPSKFRVSLAKKTSAVKSLFASMHTPVSSITGATTSSTLSGNSGKVYGELSRKIELLTETDNQQNKEISSLRAQLKQVSSELAVQTSEAARLQRSEAAAKRKLTKTEEKFNTQESKISTLDKEKISLEQELVANTISKVT